MSADLFSDLGLADGVAAAAEEAGFDTPTSIQEAAIPLLRRGNNVVVVGAPNWMPVADASCWLTLLGSATA